MRKILAADIAQAKTLGYRIRLIVLAEIDGDIGSANIFQRVEPCLVPLSHPLAHVTGATNAVVAEGNFSGRLLFQGAGAGDKPTASAVVADLVDIARKETGPAFSMPAAELERLPRAASAHRISKTYLRMLVADRVGVLAEITAAMRDAGITSPQDVHFVQIINRKHIRLRIWERGGGIPLGSGSCCCGAVVNGIRRGLLDPGVEVECDGGTVTVDWDGSGPVFLSGPVEATFSGTLADKR